MKRTGASMGRPDPECDCCHGEGFVDRGPSVSVCRCVDFEQLRADVRRLAIDALTDVLVDYDVPTERIVSEFKRTVAAYAEAGGA